MPGGMQTSDASFERACRADQFFIENFHTYSHGVTRDGKMPSNIKNLVICPVFDENAIPKAKMALFSSDGALSSISLESHISMGSQFINLLGHFV